MVFSATSSANPLLTMTDLFRCIPSHSPVSVIHECSSSCTYTHIHTTTILERESVDSHHLLFLHDLSVCFECVLYTFL